MHDAPDAPGSPGPGENITPHPALKPLRWTDPLRWLGLGWQDFRRAPGIGLFYGACFAAMGWALLLVLEHAPASALALSAGFLLMGPFLCLGLYRVSQRLEAGEKPAFDDSLGAWRSCSAALGIFGLLLLVLEMLWGRVTLVLFALNFDNVPGAEGSLGALLAWENLPFLAAWMAVGAVFAGLVYALAAVSIPMILHRRCDAVSAGLTSVRLVLAQPGVMLGWAALIALLVGLALLPGFAGLLIVGPVVGHASWHAYRAAVAD